MSKFQGVVTMLVFFKSPPCGDVVMFAQNARELLAVIGKHPEDARGIITVEQLPEAISALRAAIDADKKKLPELSVEAEQLSTEGGGSVRFFQRAVPLLEMLECSLQEKVPVTWGV